ncbi:MAG TPA: GNAT family N-acetyltransferase [Thermoplasmata archaeon]|nr:GNAT family N-acetyltransferase [Thermoplasmata archaeon]
MYSLRSAVESDLTTLVRHRRRMWEDIAASEAKFAGIGPDQLDQADDRYRAWLEAKMRSGEVFGHLAEAPDGIPAASGCLWLREEVPRPTRPQGRMPYILSVYTEPAHRRRGLGRDITAALIDIAAAAGYPRVRLNASVLGEPLYRAMGFEPSSERQLDLAGWRSRPRPP